MRSPNVTILLPPQSDDVPVLVEVQQPVQQQQQKRNTLELTQSVYTTGFGVKQPVQQILLQTLLQLMSSVHTLMRSSLLMVLRVQ